MQIGYGRSNLGSNGKFVDRSDVTGAERQGTSIDGDIFNQIMEELETGVIEAAGLVPTYSNLGQIASAINIFIERGFEARVAKLVEAEKIPVRDENGKIFANTSELDEAEDTELVNILALRKYASVDIFDIIYPVGSIYMSVNNAAPLIGTWEAYAQGRTLIGVDDTVTETENEDGDIVTSYSDYPTAELEGGEAEVTLTTAQMPAHTHTFSGVTHRHSLTCKGEAWYGSSLCSDGSGDTETKYSNYTTAEGTNASTGSGQAHNNLPPYITTYMFKRIA